MMPPPGWSQASKELKSTAPWVSSCGSRNRPPGRGEAEAALKALAGSSLWISAKIMDEAQAALRQIFSSSA